MTSPTREMRRDHRATVLDVLCVAGVYRCKARIGEGPEAYTSIELLLADRVIGTPNEPQSPRCTAEAGADYRPDMALTPRTPSAFDVGDEIRVVCSVWAASSPPVVRWSGPGGRSVVQRDVAIPAEEERDTFDQVFDGGQSFSAARAASRRSACAYKRAVELHVASADANTAGTYTCTAYNTDGQQRSVSLDLQHKSIGSPSTLRVDRSFSCLFRIIIRIRCSLCAEFYSVLELRNVLYRPTFRRRDSGDFARLQDLLSRYVRAVYPSIAALNYRLALVQCASTFYS